MQAPNSYTSSFKRRSAFLLKCALLATALASGLWCATPLFQDRYPAVLADKFDRLNSIQGPKIVVIGNSNVAFGIDSSVLQETFGRPAVNAGLHAGFSGDFLERMALVNPQPGDIYVLCHPRYDDDYRPTNPAYLLMAMEKNWRLYSMIRKDEWLQLMRGIPGYVRAILDELAMRDTDKEARHAAAARSAYSRLAFDANGNNIFPREHRYSRSEIINPPPGPTPLTIDRINALARTLRTKGATLVVAGIPIVDDPQTASPEEFTEFSQKLQALLECPVISDFGQYIMPRELFFDNCMHLTREGATIRTQRLAQDLKEFCITEHHAANKSENPPSNEEDKKLNHPPSL